MSRFTATAALASLVAAGPSVYSQQTPFFHITTTDDASVVFTWSRYPLKTEGALSNRLGLYRFAAGSVARVASDVPFLPLPNWASESLNVHMTGDGETLIWTIVRRCTCCSACIGVTSPVWESRILRRGSLEPQAIPGLVQISNNGRYVLRSRSGPRDLLQDLQTGAEWELPARPLERGRAITSDGRVLLVREAGGLALWSPAEVVPFSDPVSSSLIEASVSDDGRVAIYRTTDGVLTRVERGRGAAARRVLGSGSDAMLSKDGEVTMYRGGSACFVTRRDQTEARALSLEGVQECALAGSGEAAVVILNNGQILQANLSSLMSAVRELVPPTAYGFVSGTLAPGAVLTWSGQGRVRLLLDGTALPIIRDAGELWFQAPFDLEADGAPHRLEVQTASPFGHPAQEMTVSERAPYFFSQDGGLIAAHQGFHGVVSNADPARPGEVVHLWAAGLGAVTPSIGAGVPAPTSPLSTLVAPFDCRVLRGAVLDVPFAGLAPGLAGVYQVDVRLPSNILERSIFLSCGTTGVETQRHGGILPVVPTQ